MWTLEQRREYNREYMRRLSKTPEYREYIRQYQQNNPERYSIARKKNVYGLDAAAQAKMLEDQAGYCALCFEGKATDIDHNHTTNEVRAILCGRCNKGLGYFHDSADRLNAAIYYLIRPYPIQSQPGGIRLSRGYADGWKDRKLLQQYGISLRQLRDLERRQNKECAICQRVTPLNVDHEHDTGLVRGLLCSACNLGLGYLSTPDALEAAIAYLNKFNGTND